MILCTWSIRSQLFYEQPDRRNWFAWFLIKMWTEGTRVGFWGTCRQVGFKRGHGTNPHSTSMRGGSACEESLKQGAGGRWTSEQGGHARALWHVVPAVVTSASWQQELGCCQRGWWQIHWQGGAVATESCPCRRLFINKYCISGLS